MFKEFQRIYHAGQCIGHGGRHNIGVAFGKIITSLVNDILMPPIGLLFGKLDFSNLFINLSGTSYISLAE